MSYNGCMRIFVLLLIVLFSLFLVTKNVEAKVLPQAQKSGQKALVKKGGSGIGVYPKIRSDRKALIVNFSNLQNASAVSYLLTYKTGTQQEGATGALTLGGSSATQELLFGTCSKNVCRYHTGIKDAKLEVSYTSKSGKKYLKKYKIRV